MSITLIANIISFIGAVIMVSIGFMKKKEHVLTAQCVQFGVLGTSNLLLGGVTGFISNIISIARNVVCNHLHFGLAWKLVFIALQLALSIPFNTNGLLGLLPVVASVVFTWFLDTDNAVFLKGIIIITCFMWVIYDFALQNYVAFAFDILNIASNMVGILAIRRSMAHGKSVTA